MDFDKHLYESFVRKSYAEQLEVIKLALKTKFFLDKTEDLETESPIGLTIKEIRTVLKKPL